MYLDVEINSRVTPASRPDRAVGRMGQEPTRRRRAG
jgi:hypothetical protein